MKKSARFPVLHSFQAEEDGVRQSSGTLVFRSPKVLATATNPRENSTMQKGTNTVWLTPRIALATIAALLVGCSTPHRIETSTHNAEHQVRASYVDIAVNLGAKYDSDLLKLHDSLTAAGFRCGMRAISSGAEQIAVEAPDFDRAKAAITKLIVRDKLTVRVYESADSNNPPYAPILEVWEHGKRTRKETCKLYFDL